MRRLLFIFLTGLCNLSLGHAQIVFKADLDGSQENPPVTTNARGTGWFMLNAAATQLTYSITVNGLTMTAAHFHNGPVGTNAGVVKNLSFTNNSASGVWSSTDASQPLSDSLLSELLRGRLYVNVHTSGNPGGEIRGQVLLAGPVGFSARLEGSQENPPVTTSASGTGAVTLNADGSVTYDLTVTGITPTASHFHNAPIGTNGSVVKNITLANNTATGSWAASDGSQPLTDLLLRELVRARLYMNVHTAANTGGEIRGQVLLNIGASFTAKLDGGQENPAVSTTATGTGFFVLNASGSQLTYRITVNGLTMTASHFHNGAAGINAAVVRNLTYTNNTSSGVWGSADASQPLSDSLLSELLRGRLYVNVHTAANTGGEIRGQVVPTSAIPFTAMLEGGQENPPVTTAASGTGYAIFKTDGSVGYGITVTGLTPTASHFHNAATGTNGGVVKNITLVNNNALGAWASGDASQPLTDFLLREIVKGRTYMNVHTAANAGGEIRGQLGGANGVATSVERREDVSTPTEFLLEQNYPNPFNPLTNFEWRIADFGMVRLSVFDMLGREVAILVNEALAPGTYRRSWDASGMSSGVYFYRLHAGNFVDTKKLLLIK